MTETLTAARNYLAAGFSLFPLAYRTKDPKRNLLPLVDGVHTWKPFQVERPTEDQVKSWFNGPPCNIALVMGQVSGRVIAIDFDVEEAYLAWVKKYPQLGPDCTATAETGKGYHVLVRMPAPLPRSWKITYTGQHIGETRGEGGYIAVWPSIHPSGRQYTWITPPWEKICSVNSLAELGLSRAVEETKPQRFENPLRFEDQQPNGKHPLPPRTIAFMNSGSLGQSARGVNDELYHAAVQHAAAGYSPDETLSALMPAAEKFYIGTGDGNTESQARRTILSGWKGGEGKQPIHSPGPNGHGPIGAAPQPDPALAGKDDGPNVISLHETSGLKAAYSQRGGEMVYTTYKQVKDDIIALEKVFPFWGHVTQKTTLFDESSQTVIYTIEGGKDGKKFTAEITAQDFADGNRLFTRLLNYLPGKPPAVDPPLINRLATAIAAITPDEKMHEIKAITSTGWTPDGKAYVLPGGSVGLSDYQCKLDLELGKEFFTFGLRKNTPEENKVAWEAIMGLFAIYRFEVIHTALAHAFLPPLLRWLGDEARYLYHIHADTGSFKTELAKLLMALYGPTGSAGLTYKWSGTPYGAEARAYALKDCLMLIDDLKPGTVTIDALPKWVAFVQAAVDAQGRKRATVGGKAAASLPPRALLLSTGEAVPEAGEASYSARMLLAQLSAQPAGVRNTKLDEIKAVAPLFSGLMGAYIQWLLTGNGRGALEKFKEFQAQSLKTEHTRLSNNYAANSTGAAMLVQFCLEHRLMTDKEAALYQDGYQVAIQEIVGKTGDKVKSERYSWKFLDALRNAVSTGYATISSHICDRRIAWEDDDYIYLLSGSFEVVNQWLRLSGQSPINISKAELRKQLFHDKCSYCTDAREKNGWFDHQATDPATKARVLVIALYRDKFNTHSEEQNVKD